MGGETFGTSAIDVPAFCFYKQPVSYAAHYTLNLAFGLTAPIKQSFITKDEKADIKRLKRDCLQDPGHLLELRPIRVGVKNWTLEARAYFHDAKGKEHEIVHAEPNFTDKETLFLMYAFYQNARAITIHHDMPEEEGGMPAHDALEKTLESYRADNRYLPHIITAPRVMLQPIIALPDPSSVERQIVAQFEEINAQYDYESIHAIKGKLTGGSERDFFAVDNATEFVALHHPCSVYDAEEKEKIYHPERYLIFKVTQDDIELIGGTKKRGVACQALEALSNAYVPKNFRQSAESLACQKLDYHHYSNLPTAGDLQAKMN